ncbi:MAG: DUF354 domain-containing protein [Thermoplasmata archaeon]|nr:MAG: DUF354 domain-containing protein [Thermoplasmata archaeon]
MRIVFDVLHPAHLNFFKNAMAELEKQDIIIDIIYRRRGQIKAVLAAELPHKKCQEVGRHYKTLAGTSVALLKREYNIMKFLRSQEFNLTMGVAGFYVGFPAKVLGKPAITFTDDWEYKTTFYLSKYCANYLVIPSLIPAGGKKILKYRGYKELAYLHPRYYKPSTKVVKSAGLKPGKYVFLRLVSAVSLNYLKIATGNLKQLFSEIESAGYEIVLSPEDLQQAREYKESCTILESPVPDLHSWLANAALTVTFGDTISRESALLGTPAIYLGGRDMVVNNELIEMGCLKKLDNSKEILAAIKASLESDDKRRTKKMVQKAYENNTWLDTTQVILDICRGVLEDNRELINKYRE